MGAGPGDPDLLTVRGRHLLEQAGLTPADIPKEWGAFWSFWCDQVQPAVRRATGRNDVYGIGLPMSIEATDTWFQFLQFVAAYDANYVAPDGKPAPVDEGVRTFVGKLVGWTEEGKMLKEVWVSAAGSTYRAAAEDFINAQIPFYYSGSWQVANLSTKIGDAFDWVATGSPCGSVACSGLQGGAALVAIKDAGHMAPIEQPVAVAAALREWLDRL